MLVMLRVLGDRIGSSELVCELVYILPAIFVMEVANLICIDGCMDIIPIFYFDRIEDMMNTESFEPFDW